MVPWLMFAVWFSNAAIMAKPASTGARGLPVIVAINHLAAGRYEQAVAVSNRLVQSRSTAPAGSAIKGIALARMGRYADALPWLGVSNGLSIFENQGGRKAYADALRAVGEGRRAWEVRSVLAEPGGRAMQRLRAMCHGIDDLLSVGATEEAIRLGEEVLALAPGSASAHAHYAAALLAGGQQESAEWHHWMSTRITNIELPQRVLNGARIAVVYGDVTSAESAWERALELRPQSVKVVAGYAAWLREHGDVDGAWAVLDGDRVQGLQDAAIVVERTQTLELIDATEARSERDRLDRLFPSRAQ